MDYFYRRIQAEDGTVVEGFSITEGSVKNNCLKLMSVRITCRLEILKYELIKRATSLTFSLARLWEGL